MMKILYVCDALVQVGGIERILVDKANLLSAMVGYEVMVVTSDQNSHPLVFPFNDAVRYVDLDIRFYQQYRYRFLQRFLVRRRLNRLFRQRLSSVVSEFHPDVVICMRTEPVRSVAASIGHTPLVFESHSSRFVSRFEHDSLFKRLYNDLVNRRVASLSHVVALTHGDAAAWRRIGHHVDVIPNVVHISNGGFQVDPQSRSVAFVGRNAYQKGIDSLFRIWRIVHQRHPDWTLYFYCDFGSEKAHFQKIADNIGGVELHDPSSNILQEYPRHTMLLLPSRYEAFGLVMPEAMSCGLPVVAFDCPYGPATIISDGENGFLVPNNDVAVFADKVCWLIEHPEQRLAMGHAAVRSSRQYTAENIMPRWDRFFRSLVSQ